MAPEIADRLQRWEQYDLSWLEENWLTKSEGLISSSNLDLAARELKRFLALPTFYFPDERFTPSAQVDAAWHQFILATPAYRVACHDFLGKFIDHVQRRPTDPPNDKGFARTLSRYHQIWGDPPPEMWAPVCYHQIWDVPPSEMWAPVMARRQRSILLPTLVFLASGLLLISLRSR